MSAFTSLRWRIAATFFVVILVLLSLTGVYLLRWTEDYYLKSISGDLQRESRAVIGFVQASPHDLPDIVLRMGQDLGHRITIIRSDGVVLADSKHNYHNMPSHEDRPEFRQAMATGSGQSTRYSATLKTRMLYVAASYPDKGKKLGVVRIAEPLSVLDKILAAIQRTFLLAGLIALIAAAVISLKLASGIIRPIECVASAARKLEKGDLSARVSVHPKIAGELGALASTFNKTAERLQGYLDDNSKQTARLQAVFGHTDNGLLLVDAENRVKMINPAACHILDIDGAVEKTLIEGTLKHDLSSLVERVSRTHEPAALDINLGPTNEKAVHAYVTTVPRPDGGTDVLVVLHDVTSLRKLDAIRQDFVANVSHELRTPLASIKAMAETIILRHSSSPDAVPGFAESIVQEADRMTLLAQDLLDLTQIDTQRRDMTTETVDIQKTVDDIFGRLTSAAESKSISLNNEVEADEIIETNAGSLVQVLMNLIDNAIKYTPEGGIVTVQAEHASNHAAIRVIDNGIGIPAEDIPRIFERFYRVDKARSRESGGTGLGLAIVKHLCEQMGGSVSVKSEIGAGTTFSVLLPDK